MDGIASANPETIERVKREAAAVLNDSFFARLDDVKQVTPPSDDRVGKTPLWTVGD